MQVLRPVRYWTQWMWKSTIVTPYHLIPLYNEMLDWMDGIVQGVATKKS